MTGRILVIDDEDSMCKFMEIMLSKEGYRVDTALSGKEGVDRFRNGRYDLVLADLNMPEMSGIDVLREIKSTNRDQDLIVMTAYASVDSAIEAMKQGASDYITKPFKIDEIKLAIEKSINHSRLLSENQDLKRQLNDDKSFEGFIGTSEPVVLMKKLATRVAATDSIVLIRGESGTGKDLIAKAIHHESPRSDGPFVTINCAALPETLLESELFGHKKGAFTGAIRDKDGLFKAAHGGTFFLDEVGNTSTAIQVKLLRVLEDKMITPVGDTKPIEVDVRLIAATNSDLEADVKASRFREDLFYRLNVLPIQIPPLRDRQEDITLLVNHFVAINSRKLNVPVKEVSEEAMNLLTSYHWPGNVRELENTIERAVLLNRGDVLEPSDFPDRLHSSESSSLISSAAAEESAANPTLEFIEKAYIHFVLTQTKGNRSEAAKILGIDVSTLYRKIDRYGMKADSFK